MRVINYKVLIFNQIRKYNNNNKFTRAYIIL